MKPVVLGIVIALALSAAAYLFLSAPAPLPETPSAVGTSLYANGTYGVSFAYPAGYLLSEGETGEGSYAVTLIREEDAVPVIGAGEGPTAVTLEFVPASEDFTLSDWLASPRSNFHLSDGTYASTTAAGKEAVHYGWSGLYEGETTAFLHEDWVVAVSVTYFSPADPIRSAYEQILETLRVR